MEEKTLKDKNEVLVTFFPCIFHVLFYYIQIWIWNRSKILMAGIQSKGRELSCKYRKNMGRGNCKNIEWGQAGKGKYKVYAYNTLVSLQIIQIFRLSYIVLRHEDLLVFLLLLWPLLFCLPFSISSSLLYLLISLTPSHWTHTGLYSPNRISV